jgi:hypothetical protein
MRTTVNLDEDVLRVARSLADAQQTSLGRVISDLVRKALSSAAPLGERSGFPVFRVGRDARPITLDDVARWQDEA